MKRIIALICVMFIVFGACCGCNPDSASSGDDGASSTTNSDSQVSAGNDSTASSDNQSSGEGGYTRPTPNLGGKTIKVLAWFPNYVKSKKGESAFGDAYKDAIAAVEKELNFKFQWNFVSSDELSSIVISHAASGSREEDIVMPVLWNTSSLYTSRSLVDLNTVKSVDTSASYWNQTANKLLTANGIQRAAIGNFCNIMSEETVAVWFNKRLISELKLENPYDLVKSNKWTVSKLREMAKAATNPSNEQFGITTLDYKIGFGKYVLAANNQQFLTKQSNGTYKYNMSTELCDTLDYIQSWIFDDKSICTVQEQEAQRATFKNGKSLFYVFQVSELNRFTDMKDDFGIVPFPRGDKVSEYRGQIHFSTITCGIPVTVKGDDLYNAGAVLQALAYHSDGLAKKRESELKSRYMRDSESREMFDKYISKCGVLEPDSLAATPRQPEIEAGTTHILGDVCGDSNQSASTLMSRNKMSTMSAILQFNNAISK